MTTPTMTTHYTKKSNPRQPSTPSLILSLTLTLLTLSDVTKAVSRPTAITISTNGYDNILVAIHPSTRETSSLVNDIKSMFTGGSSYLHYATDRRAYFRSVTILVPNTWSDNGGYQQASSELYSNADVVIQDPIIHKRRRSDTTVGPPPVDGAFTRSYGGCGQRGVRINIFTDIFGRRGQYKYGPSGRTLVHHWANFRWGVFDEFSQEGEPQFYFSPTTGRLEAVRCNIHMVGRVYKKTPSGVAEQCLGFDPATGMYPDECVFDPYTIGGRNSNITASIMDRQKVPSIIHFCNDDRSNRHRVHNYESPSRHNRLCGSRSTWAVISQNQDFHGGQNAPRDVPDLAPTFKVVRLTSARRMVMAVDTSESMQDDEKLTKARQAATSFIEDGLDDDTEVGVVTFDTVAKIAAPMVKVDSPGSRSNVTRKLPATTGGATSVGAALLTALKLLSDHDANATDAFIVIVTDGRETASPTIADVMGTVKAAGAVVSVILFSEADDTALEKLAKDTGGRYYFDSNHDMSTVAVDAMMDLYSLFVSGKDQVPVQIISRANSLPRGASMGGSFLVDPSLGRDTRVIFTYTDQLPVIRVTSPSGRLYSALYPEFSIDDVMKRVKVTIPRIAEPGPWTFSITNQHSGFEKVSILVLSSTQTPDMTSLRFTGAIFVQNDTWPLKSHIVASATRGERPVKNLRVKATVERPHAEPVEMELFDHGAGADIIKDDGLYSRYFTAFSRNGRYTVRVEMLTKDGDVMVTGDMASAYAGTVHVTHPRLDPANRHDVTDDIPPMRITDLRVLHTARSNSSGLVVLAWTAPGGDADVDKAHKYIIRMTGRADDLVDGNATSLPATAVVKGSLTQPKYFGEIEQIMLQLAVPQSANVSMVVAVVAQDEAGNSGGLSNIVTVGFGFVPDMTTREYMAEDHSVAQDAKDPPHSQKIVIAGVVGAVATLLGVTVAITVAIQLNQNRRKNKANSLERRSQRGKPKELDLQEERSIDMSVHGKENKSFVV